MSMLSIITQTRMVSISILGPSGHSLHCWKCGLPIEKEDIVMQTSSCKLPHCEWGRLRKKFRKSPGINSFETKSTSVATENSVRTMLGNEIIFWLKKLPKSQKSPLLSRFGFYHPSPPLHELASSPSKDGVSTVSFFKDLPITRQQHCFILPAATTYSSA